MPDPEPRVSARCPIRTSLEILGGKWRLLLLYQLKNGALRPSEMRRRIPDISEKVLTQELKLLTESALIVRINYGEVPPRVEYSLTELGREALPLVEQLAQFGSKYDRAVRS